MFLFLPTPPPHRRKYECQKRNVFSCVCFILNLHSLLNRSLHRSSLCMTRSLQHGSVWCNKSINGSSKRESSQLSLVQVVFFFPTIRSKIEVIGLSEKKNLVWVVLRHRFNTHMFSFYLFVFYTPCPPPRNEFFLGGGGGGILESLCPSVPVSAFCPDDILRIVPPCVTTSGMVVNYHELGCHAERLLC